MEAVQRLGSELHLSTNQKWILCCVNQSEVSIILCQPIRKYDSLTCHCTPWRLTQVHRVHHLSGRSSSSWQTGCWCWVVCSTLQCCRHCTWPGGTQTERLSPGWWRVQCQFLNMDIKTLNDRLELIYSVKGKNKDWWCKMNIWSYDMMCRETLPSKDPDELRCSKIVNWQEHSKQMFRVSI